MPGEQAIRDQNRVTAMLFKGSDGGTYNAQGDENTGRLYVDLAGGGDISGSGTANQIAYFTDTTEIASLDTTTYPSLTELSYVKGVTSAIQTQLNAKGSGTVTSVAMTVPTGLTISGSPVTTSGTLAVALDTGYVIPLQSTLDGKANTALSNLASVAINTDLISDTESTDSIGSTGVRWLKGWFDDMETTNMPTVGGTAILSSLTAPSFTTSVTVPQVFNADNAITASSNAATVTRAYRNNVVTNDSAATLTITMSTTSATGGDMVLVQILDASAVAQTITWVNTENSTVSVPTTSNGSTTLPLTVGFKWNTLTSKWRCIASA